MSNYYEYKDAKLNLYRVLMLNNWKCYGYKPDQSDSMTDYYDPANWEGIAEKNGYILVVDCKKYMVDWYSGKIEYEYTNKSTSVNKYYDKIEQLKKMTLENSCTENEVLTAKQSIENIYDKIDKEEEQKEQSKVIKCQYPVFQENPGRCNWHIEKDGKIIDKGTGIIKFADSLLTYYWDYEKKEIKTNYRDEDTKLTEEQEKLIKAFYNLINRLEKHVSIKCGNDEIKEEIETGYKKIIVTEYKKENKANPINNVKFEDIKEGMYFILNKSFTHGCSKGYVYKIGVINEYYFNSSRLNGKLTKVLTGTANSSNSFCTSKEKFKKWLEKGLISICKIEEVKTPYQVEKLIKETTSTKKATKKQNNNNNEEVKTTNNNIDDNKIYWIKIYNAKHIKDILKKQYNYWFYSKDLSWFKNIKGNSINEELERLNTIEGINDCIIEVVEKETGNKIDINNTQDISTKEITDNLTERSYYKMQELNIFDGYWNNEQYKTWLFDYISQYTKQQINDIYKQLEDKYYSKIKMLIKEYLNNNNPPPDKDHKRNNFDKLIEKCNQNINSFQKKLDNISGEYLTNTRKRQQEELSRDKQRQSYKYDIRFYEYLKTKITDNSITEEEINYLNVSFNNMIYNYYIIKYGQNREIIYPNTNNCAEWYKAEQEKKIKRLQKANINNAEQLNKIVDRYKIIIDIINNNHNSEEDDKQRIIKEMEMKLQFNQGKDIHFTPKAIVNKMIDHAGIKENDIVLESSAGIGNIADGITYNNVDVIEINPSFRELLKLKGYNVIGSDFLEFNEHNKYNKIIMNPPFSKNQDIKHLKHAYNLLDNNGKIISLTSKHWSFAQDKESLEFRNWLESIDYRIIDSNISGFSDTNISCMMIEINK